MLPSKIQKLDISVINKIAAGEVIQNPCCALKEMLENSLDAESTSISITVKQGGLALLHIQDNGTGICKDSLGILCERFTTSKLSKFDDLLGINTYGFRGEALSSISQEAYVTIVTKTADSPVGYKVCYSQGVLKGSPQPVAAMQGTQIRVEDMFRNHPSRRAALNPSEEYVRIYEVVSRYAVLNYNVSFSLKKDGKNSSDVKTPPNSTALDNIRLIYGNNVASELLEIKENDNVLKLSYDGYVSNVNYSSKKFLFLLFINRRLVISSALRRVIEQIYSTYLPKGSRPFVFLNVNLNPKSVDVNVHPTKYEVHFLHEEAIIEKIRKAIETRLSSCSSSRNLYTQAKLPTQFAAAVPQHSDDPKIVKKVYAHELNRVDGSEQKIDKFFNASVSLETVSENSANPSREIKLSSISKLRETVKSNLHQGLFDLIKNFSFVGLLGPQCLLQHNTNLYLCSTSKIIEQFFYQTVLSRFANFGIMKFTKPLNIVQLIQLVEKPGVENNGEIEECDSAESKARFLEKHAEMLEDYFSIEIRDGDIDSIPLLLNDYTPNLKHLPEFLSRMCSKVDWDSEEKALEGISNELAIFYSHPNDDDSKWKQQVEHVLLPAAKATMLPPKSFAVDGTVIEIARLSDLYRVFERC